ncbi:MAG TPA: hypothetical protein VK846_15500 [Candidatus Limnocylindria bacterium]|nr:hypothetical protein [Candidatus Limnocylindria bacterium]
MRTILHILTRPADALAQELITHQRALAETEVDVVELSDGAPDYDGLLDKVFAADSIEVW